MSAGLPERGAAQAAGVSVVLLNYKGWRDTLACVDSLLAQSAPCARIVVCDNASPDDSLARLRDGLSARAAAAREALARWGRAEPGALFLEQRATQGQVEPDAQAQDALLVLIDNGENRGFAAGNNPGIRFSLADPRTGFVWLLNNDTEVPADCVAELLAAANARPEVGLWGATLVYHDQREVVQALGGGAVDRRTAATRHVGAFTATAAVREDAGFVAGIEAQLDYILGASMFATRAWVEQVGLLHEGYFLYYEELDWASRAPSGLTLGYAPRAIVWHKEGASIGTEPGGGSALSVYHLFRSRVLYARRFLPTGALWGVVRSALWRQLKWLAKGSFNLVIASTKGVVAGLTHARDAS